MSKKYLLYIHYEAFAQEKNKSALVNKLLADHYGLDVNDDNTVSVASITPVHIAPKASTRIESHTPVPTPEFENDDDWDFDKVEDDPIKTSDKPRFDFAGDPLENPHGICEHDRELDECPNMGCYNNPNNRNNRPKGTV